MSGSNKLRTTILLLVISFICFYSGAKAVEMGNAELGFRVAAQICAECHSISAEGSLSPNNNAPEFKEIANTSGMSAQALYVWLRSPHPTMPNLKLEIQNEEDVIAYILSLKDKN